MPRDEVEREIADQVGAVLAVFEVAFFAVVFEAGVGVARRAAGVLPEARFVEAEVAAASL